MDSQLSAGPLVDSPTAGSPTSGSPTPADFALKMSPTRLAVGPTDFGTSRITVLNQGRSPTAVTVQERDFTTRPDGTPEYRQNVPNAALTWLTVNPTSFSLAPGATQTVSVTYQVPAEAEPGDHQLALAFINLGAHGTGNIRLNRGIAIPVRVTVPGQTTDSVLLAGLRAPGFALWGPVTVTATVRSTGNVHRDFRDSSRLVLHAAGSPAVFPDFTVQRGASRDIGARWYPPLACICHPSVTIVDADGSLQAAAVRVVVFPVHLLVLAIAALAGFALFQRLRRGAPQPRHAAGPGEAADRAGDP